MSEDKKLSAGACMVIGIFTGISFGVAIGFLLGVVIGRFIQKGNGYK